MHAAAERAIESGVRTARRVIGCTLAVVMAGSLLHFAHEWSGRSPIVAVIAPIDESTWEHLKMAFWPALALAPLQHRLYRSPPGLLPATVIRVLVPPVLIVVLFYGYTSILGANRLALDVATFVIAVVAGESAGHRVMSKRVGDGVRRFSVATLVVAIIGFSTLSFLSPPGFLFEDPRDVERRHSAGSRAAWGGVPGQSDSAFLPGVVVVHARSRSRPV